MPSTHTFEHDGLPIESVVHWNPVTDRALVTYRRYSGVHVARISKMDAIPWGELLWGQIDLSTVRTA